MNFIDKFRIRRNPNIIDSFSEAKLSSDVITYAIECGYKFNSDTFEKFISNSNYQEAFKEQDEVFIYLKKMVLDNSNKKDMQRIYYLYSNQFNDKNKFIDKIKDDSELSKYVLDTFDDYRTGIYTLDAKDAVSLIDGKDEFLDEFLEKNFEKLTKDVTFGTFAEYIATQKSPNELYNKNIKNSTLDIEFLKTADPQKFLEVFENSNEREFRSFTMTTEIVMDNIEQFLPYLSRIDKAFQTNTKRNFITEDLKKETMRYLKDNNVLYNESFPGFVLEDNEYILKSILQDPKIMSSMRDLRGFDLENYKEETELIAKKIYEENIRFEEIIPYPYKKNQKVFESIVSINPILLENEENRTGLKFFILGKSDQEVVNYYKKIGVPFNRETVIDENVLLVLECLKNDHMTLSSNNKLRTNRLYTKEEYKKMYDCIKDQVKIEEILENNFLRENPYFLNKLLKNKADLSNINLQDTKYYTEFYRGLLATATKNGVSIPEPRDYNDIIKASKSNGIYINLDNIENVGQALEYLEKEGINQDLLIELRQNNEDEYIISDNIELFEELDKNNININFKYDNGKEIFTLKDVLEDEHFIQNAAEEIKSKNFSPLEQLIAVYDIAKVFKPYNKYEEPNRETAVSRSLYEYLGNEYMVCAGYVDLICNLGHRLGAQFTKMSLMAGNEFHVRNYVNLVDPKYNIDGFYVLEPTWEHNGTLTINRNKQIVGKYDNFLLTTDEGRTSEIDVEGYDKIFTAETPEQLRAAESKSHNKILKKIKDLDPNFYKSIENLDLKNDESANTILNYLNSKINNPVNKEALLEAVITVNKTKYINLSEQDFEDMRMMYSVLSRFSNETNEKFLSESLYGKDTYNAYLERRYNDIKSDTIENAKENNPCLSVNTVISHKKVEVLKDNKLFSNLKSNYSHTIENQEYIDLLENNREKIEELGYTITVNEPDEEFNEKSVSIYFPQSNKKLSIEEQINDIKRSKKELYIILGLEKEKSQTQLLCEQTLDEQNDTKGKSDVQNEISRQLEYEREEQKDQIIQ